MQTKICNKCRKEFPATTEYFHRDNHNKDGLFNTCKECRKTEKKNYMANNKEKIKQSSKEYYKANKLAIKEKSHQRYLKNKGKLIAQSMAYRKSHPEYYKHQKIYAEENKDKIKARIKKWYLANEDRCKAARKNYYKSHKGTLNAEMREHYQEHKLYYDLKTLKRRAKGKNILSDLTKSQWEECLKFFDYKDAYTGLPMQVISKDHIIPLSKGGAFTKNNIIPCDNCINASKNNEDMETWYRKQPFFSKERLKKINEWRNSK